MRPYGPESPWRLDPDVIQLNHGSYGACPVPVLEAQRAWQERLEADPTRFLSRELEGLLDAARVRIATFLDADAEGLAFLPNATTGVSTVLGSLRFRPGDELLTTDHEYNATLNALAAAARRDGAAVSVAAIPYPIDNPSQAVEAILAAVTPRTRLALISHATSPTALVLPVEDIVRELDHRGIDTLVDAAHAPGMVPLSVRKLGAAYWATNGHKWLCAPKGSAVLHVREDRRASIRPLVVSHGWNDRRVERSAFRREFDWLGTVDPTAYLAFADAIDLVGSLDPGGWPGLMAANHDLAVRGRQALADALGLPLPAPTEMTGAMASLPLPGVGSDAHARALERSLAEDDRIEVPLNGWPVPAARPLAEDPPRLVLARISAQRYNEPADFDALAATLRRRLVSPS